MDHDFVAILKGLKGEIVSIYIEPVQSIVDSLTSFLGIAPCVPDGFSFLFQPFQGVKKVEFVLSPHPKEFLVALPL